MEDNDISYGTQPRLTFGAAAGSEDDPPRFLARCRRRSVERMIVHCTGACFELRRNFPNRNDNHGPGGFAEMKFNTLL